MTIDTTALLAKTDLLALIEADLGPGKRSGRWWLFRCPFHEDSNPSLAVTPDTGTWHCFACGKSGDAISWLREREGLTFPQAVERLGGGSYRLTAPRPARAERAAADQPPGQAWQDAALDAALAAADVLLLKPGGQPGRDYLVRRGLHQGVWEAFTLGFSRIYGRPAIVLPWFADEIRLHAIKYRFIDNQNPRYIARKGSVPILYGLEMTFAPPATTLLVCEGEINALSIWQMRPSGVDVVSVGSESGGRPELLNALAAKYERVVLWFDKPDQARKTQAAIGKMATLLQSPMIDGRKMDANAILQASQLDEFLSGVLNTRCTGWKIETMQPEAQSNE